MENLLKALKNIEAACDSSLQEHYTIWHIAHAAIKEYEQVKNIAYEPVLAVVFDEEIEDWYTKDFDTLETTFWQQAPYCTHGDRVEEIKDAVKHFLNNR